VCFIVYRRNTMKQRDLQRNMDERLAASQEGALSSEGVSFSSALASLAKALGHPARVEIIRLLLQEGSCMCGDIVRRLPLAQSTVSQHLRHLREARLVHYRRQGSRLCYYVNTDVLERLQELLRVLGDDPTGAAGSAEG